MAHIVAGFVSRRPATIEDGLRLLRGRSNVSPRLPPTSTTRHAWRVTVNMQSTHHLLNQRALCRTIRTCGIMITCHLNDRTRGLVPCLWQHSRQQALVLVWAWGPSSQFESCTAAVQSDLLILGVISYVLLADTRAACRLLMEAESRGYFR